MHEQYWQVQLIKRGGFGNVYRAVDKLTGKYVAIKVLREPTPDNMERFERERKVLLEQYDNHHSVNLLESDMKVDCPYLVLEFANGGTLDRWVTSRHGWKDIARVLHQLARGLEPLHRNGGFHRDIKPSNVLLFIDAAGKTTIKLSDFGLAQRPNLESGTMSCEL